MTRDPVEIERLLALRADRAIAHVTALARGGTPRHCPICGYVGRFSPVRHKPEIWCPGCDSRPRHRLLKLWMDREMILPPGAEVVHFAAEPWVRAEMLARGARYRTADINDQFDLVLDLTRMDLADSSLNMVIANHVLEHLDDVAALREMYRVLRPGGQAVLTVPMIEGWDHTHENPGLDQDARHLQYGDASHLRFYGKDFRNRVRAAGFTLTEACAMEPDVSRHALHRGERIFVATKPPALETPGL